MRTHRFIRLLGVVAPAVIFGTQLPEMIDFNKHQFMDTYFDSQGTWTKTLADQALRMGAIAFNGGPEMGAFFLMLQAEYGIDTVVETGTYRGFSCSFFARWFGDVHTIEISEPSYQMASDTFRSFPNVHCHLGSSEKVLQKLLPSLTDKPIVFYLDAHWHDYWPLLDEMEAISKTHKDNCVIVIDDVQVPGRPDLGYDQYGKNICRLEYFEKGLSQVFTEYSSHYLIPKDALSRAKFVAMPKNFTPLKNEDAER